MFAYWTPVFLLVGSNVLYHLCQKRLSATVHPLYVLGAMYLVAFVVVIGLAVGLGFERPTLRETGAAPFALVGLALACVGIEAGFLFAYRSGWHVGTLSAIVGPFTCALLILGAACFFQQKITVLGCVGILTSALGVAIVHLAR